MTQNLSNKKIALISSLGILAASNLLAQGSYQVPLSSLTLNGTAAYGANVLQLTNGPDQAASAFIPTPYTLGTNDAFEVMFAYHAYGGSGNPADGLALVAQNTPLGAHYLGFDGSGLGFFTLTSSPAIAATFDYYLNSYTGTPGRSASIATPDGVDIQTVFPTPDVFGGSGASGIRYVWVDYNNATRIFAVYYSATPTKPATPILATVLARDLSSEFGGQVYFGLTGGTGQLQSVQRIETLAVAVINK